MVLAGLLPQVTTYDHCFTNVSLHSTSNELTLTICSRPIFKSIKRLSILVAGLLTICSCSFMTLRCFQHLEQAVPSPSDGRHACSRRCQLALDLTVRGTGHLYPPPALSGRLQCGWCCFVFVFDFVALLGTIYPMFLRHFHPVVADRRATARTTVTLSHAATSQKKII